MQEIPYIPNLTIQEAYNFLYAHPSLIRVSMRSRIFASSDNSMESYFGTGAVNHCKRGCIILILLAVKSSTTISHGLQVSYTSIPLPPLCIQTQV